MLTRQATCRCQLARAFSIAAPAFPAALSSPSERRPKPAKRAVRADAAVAASSSSPVAEEKAPTSDLWKEFVDAEVMNSDQAPLTILRNHRRATVSRGFFSARPPGFFFSGRSANRRGFATAASVSDGSEPPGDERPLANSDLFKDWDSLIENLPPPSFSPLTHGHRLRPKRATTRPRRQTMTTRETAAFEDMFELIFSAMKEDHGKTPEQRAADGDGKSTGKATGMSAKTEALFSRLKKHSRRLRGDDEMDEELGDEVDKRREEMAMCASDEELLRWSLRRVFPQISAETTPASYPYMVAELMRAFREKYGDPHLALAIFNFARHLSVTSYAFGCTTGAYNELLKTRWDGFKDLRAVVDGLEEMNVNGVAVDETTRRVVEGIRSEVGTSPTDEVRRLLMRMDVLVRRIRSDDDNSAITNRVESHWSRRRARAINDWKYGQEARRVDEAEESEDTLEMGGLWEETQGRNASRDDRRSAFRRPLPMETGPGSDMERRIRAPMPSEWRNDDGEDHLALMDEFRPDAPFNMPESVKVERAARARPLPDFNPLLEEDPSALMAEIRAGTPFSVPDSVKRDGRERRPTVTAPVPVQEGRTAPTGWAQPE